MSEGRRLRRVFAAMAAASVLTLAPLPGTANDGGNDRNEQRDTQSRHEQPPSDRIMLRHGEGIFEMRYVVLIQTRFIHVTDTFSEGIGVDFDILDRADVSDVPLLGSLFDKPLRGDDLTPENRVGAAYRGGDGTLVTVVDEAVDVSGSEVSVVNGKGRYVLTMAPKLALQPDLPDLGEVGNLGSVQTLIRGTATRQTALVIGGLTEESDPDAGSGVPALADIPVLRSFFLGNVYRVEDDELVILVRPSIITGDETDD